MPRLSLQPTRVFSAIEGQDETGQLVFYDDRLAAVLAPVIRQPELHRPAFLRSRTGRCRA